MSVMQHLCLRCHGLRVWGYHVVTNTNSICSLIRNVSPLASAVPYPASEQSIIPKLRRPQLQEPESCLIKDIFSSPSKSTPIYPIKSLSRQRILPHNESNQQDYTKENVTTDYQLLSIGHGLFYNVSDSQTKACSRVNKRVTSLSDNFSSSKVKRESEKEKGKNKKGLPSEETLEKIATVLTRDLTKLFVQRPDYSIFRHDMVFENRIHNKVL